MPAEESNALKYTTPPASTTSAGNEDTEPGLMSCTRCVPAVVPSEVHSSTPVAMSAIVK
jgi:hypothetical protein